MVQFEKLVVYAIFGFNQGPLITDGRNSSKMTGLTVGSRMDLNLEIGEYAKFLEKYFQIRDSISLFQMDNFIDRRSYLSQIVSIFPSK